MKVGDYVRTKNGYIYKIEDGEEFYEDSVDVGIGTIPDVDGIWVDKEHFQYVDKRQIVKSSPNIIDLIEVGDYVNEDKICEIIEKGQISIDGEKVKEKCFCVNNNYRFKLYNDEIKNVVTKEQFKSMQYNLESQV